MYSWFFRVFFVRFDAESVHKFVHFFLSLVPYFLLPKKNSGNVKAMGLSFDNCLGLAAGFDKNANAISGLALLGFGHIEVGTVTPKPQPGNDKPRLFRLVADRAVINRMGFNNDGVGYMKKRLRKIYYRKNRPVIGVNIGKNFVTSLDDAIYDYEISARELSPFADYIVINVSSPNTPGLRGLQSSNYLVPILKAVLANSSGKPVLVKISPDLDDDSICDIVQLVLQYGLAGIIATNTTVSRNDLVTSDIDLARIGDGGLSGAPLAERSLDVLRLLRRYLPSNVCVISVGGIFSADDIQQRLEAGADLVQAYTAFIYEGPLWPRKMVKSCS